MTADTKKLHFLFGDWVALSAHMIRSGLLIAGRRLSASNQWTRGLIVEHRWQAILEKQVINMKTREKEERLARQMADPLEAAVLLDDKHRLVGANQAALSLLGISERNIDKFTIDAFLPDLKRMGRSFIKKSERWRGCKIIRLDGSFMVGEFVCQPNVAPGRHLSRFRNVKACRDVPSEMQSKFKDSPWPAL
jgi:PAS domain-containing protein